MLSEIDRLYVANLQLQIQLQAFTYMTSLRGKVVVY